MYKWGGREGGREGEREGGKEGGREGEGGEINKVVESNKLYTV